MTHMRKCQLLIVNLSGAALCEPIAVHETVVNGRQLKALVSSRWKGGKGHLKLALQDVELQDGSVVRFLPGETVTIAAVLCTLQFEVVTWGHVRFGGDSREVADKLASSVISIHCNGCAYAALKEGGEVVTWGDAGFGGDCENVADRLA
eukprot:TRINITY_DN8665_c0_g2_i1.p1 TRINITY_DN8665_c0_g2~~TRINITY_DN8665_c0_g2_i1.p1  ORF type:complete len:149 (-),score=21.27 TRINITY_DN8665_c0_g2_i1:101-547(-)